MIKGTDISFSLNTVLQSAQAGIGEEIIFRIIPLMLAMAAYKRGDENKMLIPIIITSVIFGSTHFINLKSGALLSNTIVQVITCIPTGLMLAAFFVKTGSIWPPILIHTFNDIIAFMDSDVVQNESGIMSGALQPVDLILGILGELFFLAIAIQMLSKTNRTKIIDNWFYKWNSKRLTMEAIKKEAGESPVVEEK